MSAATAQAPAPRGGGLSRRAKILIGVGIAVGDDAGLSAALLVIGLFTVYFTVRMITRPIDAAAERKPR